MKLIEILENKFKRTDLPDFGPGDLIRVIFKVTEGGKERTQSFEGTVIRRAHGGLRETFTVRKTSYGVGVERIFPLHSPLIERIEVLRKGAVRRAKLYYLRNRTEKSARIKEKFVHK